LQEKNLKSFCEIPLKHKNFIGIMHIQKFMGKPVIHMTKKKKTATKGDLIENPQIMMYDEVTSPSLQE
jgi:hypothetical protein